MEVLVEVLVLVLVVVLLEVLLFSYGQVYFVTDKGSRTTKAVIDSKEKKSKLLKSKHYLRKFPKEESSLFLLLLSS